MHNRLFYISKALPVLVLTAIFLIPALQGCSKKSPENEKVVAVVNKEKIKLEDLQREITLRSKQNPSYKITPEAIEKQMDTMIDRRLMIQEAMRMGLAGNEDFVHTIQTFWEQTLIRELIQAKNKEWEKRLFVSEKEISDYYEKMRQTAEQGVVELPPLETLYNQIKHDILQQKRTDALETWLREVRQKSAIEVNKGTLDASFDVSGSNGDESHTFRNGGTDVR